MKRLRALVIISISIFLAVAPRCPGSLRPRRRRYGFADFFSRLPGNGRHKARQLRAVPLGGEYTNSKGNLVTLGSCQWCHYTYGYDASGDIDATLNSYGRDYHSAGQDETALAAIAELDSDGDGFSNSDEIAALRFPGNSADDPAKVPAPYRVYTRKTLESMIRHTQFMLMNTTKSGDFYTICGGVPMADLMDECGKSRHITPNRDLVCPARRPYGDRRHLRIGTNQQSRLLALVTEGANPYN